MICGTDRRFTRNRHRAGVRRMSSHPIRAASRLFLAVLLPVLVPAPASADRPPSQVILEAGGALPRGDLAADFTTEPLGFGVKSGLELGFRWRYWLNETWSVSPSFHFMNYKDFKSVAPDGEEFRIKPTSFRYVLEVMWMPGDGTRGLRPFVAVGGGLYRNRVEGFYKTYERPFDQSVNTFGASVRAGIQLGHFELSVLYSRNRFETWTLFQTGRAESYDWDNTGARVAWSVPFPTGSP
jgi:hypothetical protein